MEQEHYKRSGEVIVNARVRVTSLMIVLLLAVIAPRQSLAEARVVSNVVYGMHSGLALLLDVHYPTNPNGYGILIIPGSGWHEPISFDSTPLKQRVGRPRFGADALLKSGYTLFAINHRSAPVFRYPAAVRDAQRTVRYIRHNAARYGIHPDRIGAVGGSSGGHLVSMLGVLDGDDNSEDPNPINRESSKVQAVVAIYPITDFVQWARGTNGEKGYMTSFLGTYLNDRIYRLNPQSGEVSLYRQASPTSHVTADDPPFLLVHGDADLIVPFSQSEIFQAALNRSDVTVELIRVPGGGHSSRLRIPDAPDYIGAMVDLFDRHLRNTRK